MLTTWHARGVAALIAAACLLGAYGAGRFTAPAKVVTVEASKVTTDVRAKETTTAQADVHAAVAATADTKADVATKTTIRWLPSPAVEGCPVGPPIVEETIERTSAKTSHVEAKAERQAETKATTQAQHDAHQVTQETRTVTVTAERPQWSVTALAGASLGSPPHLIPGLPGPLVVGAQLERRILGPLSAGLWATSSGAGGVSVRLEF